MEFHLDRRLVLKPTGEQKRLYPWSIIEVDGDGRQIGEDHAPWRWQVRFEATTWRQTDTLETGQPFQLSPPTSPGLASEQEISVSLRPASFHQPLQRATSYSMFGTDRLIENFGLYIRAQSDALHGDICSAWGTVSYTSEVDFRQVTQDDCLLFYLAVPEATFGQYLKLLFDDHIDELFFDVDAVEGFYAPWSPSITADAIKVLSAGQEQKVTRAEEVDTDIKGNGITAY